MIIQFHPGYRFIQCACLFALLVVNGIGAAIPQRLDGFGEQAGWFLRLGDPASIYALADVNGDEREDLVLFYRNAFSGSEQGDVWIGLNTGGNTFDTLTRWHDWFCVGEETPLTGDFNGDGRCDVATLTRGTTADVFVALSTGTAFVGTGTRWHDNFCPGTAIPLAGDFDGDGADDLVYFNRDGTGNAVVTLSDKSSFGPAAVWLADFCRGNAVPLVGDFNGDGRDDLACFIRNSQTGSLAGDVMVALSMGNAFSPAVRWHDYFCIGEEEPLVGDFNGDGKDDVATCVPGDGPVYVATSTGSAFVGAGVRWHPTFGAGVKGVFAGRLDGDLNDDLMKVDVESAVPFIKYVSAGVALSGGHAQPKAEALSLFGHGTHKNGVNPVLGTRPLVLAYVRMPASEASSTLSGSLAHFEQLVFGPDHPNAAAYFSENSGGKFTFSKAIAVGPLDYPTTGSTPSERAKWVKRHLRSLGPSVFDYRTYDTNGDKVIDSSELAFVFIDNATDGLGATRFSSEDVVYGSDTFTIATADAHVAHKSRFVNLTHEMSHTQGTWDLYGSNACNGSTLTLMSCTAGTATPNNLAPASHLDPYHKMRFGWIEPVVMDVREAGGTAVLEVPQESARPGYHPPVLLYDSALGFHQYYLIEYRSSTYPDGIAAGNAGDPAAGYDSDVNGRGVCAWFVKTESDHSPHFQGVFIQPGDDGFLDSTRQGDDVISGNTIQMGPDEWLDSTVSGDDLLRVDAMVVATPTPRARTTRNDSVLLTSAAGVVTLEWLDRSALPVRLMVGATPPSSREVAVHWSSDFVPHLRSVADTDLNPSVPFNVYGSFGVWSSDVRPVLLDDEDNETPLNLLSWDIGSARLQSPASTSAGAYRLLWKTTDSALGSNAIAVTMRDPYRDWIVGQFTPLEIFLHPEWLDPDADPDGDAIPNVGEFALGGQARVAASLASRPAFTLGVDWFTRKPMMSVSWVERIDRPTVNVSLWHSTDLAEWKPIDPILNLELINIFLRRRGANYVIPSQEAEGFFRLAFDKLNE